MRGVSLEMADVRSSDPDDADRWSDVYRRFAPLVHARAVRLVGGDADDVVQEVFIRLLEKPPQGDALIPWLYRTTTNLCIDRMRHRRRRGTEWAQAVEALIAAKASRDTGELLCDLELCRLLMTGLDRKTQAIVSLIYFDEMSQTDAAAILGMSRRSLNRRLERFLERGRRVVQQCRR